MITLRNGNSNWKATSITQVERWAVEECYNEQQRNRQVAAQLYLEAVGASMGGASL
jgi:hypothetical protein